MGAISLSKLAWWSVLSWQQLHFFSCLHLNTGSHPSFILLENFNCFYLQEFEPCHCLYWYLHYSSHRDLLLNYGSSIRHDVPSSTLIVLHPIFNMSTRTSHLKCKSDCVCHLCLPIIPRTPHISYSKG